MRHIKLTWLAIALDIITMILATAILVTIIVGNNEPVPGAEVETTDKVVCDCTCSVEETTTPTEVTEVTEPPTTEPTEPVVTTEPTEVVDNNYLGEFKLTAYCPCEKCCDQWADGITSTGTTAVAGKTIAVDPRVIPYGSLVEINGHVYLAEDCGGSIKGNRIDVYFNTHDEALEFGVQYADVYVVGSV